MKVDHSGNNIDIDPQHDPDDIRLTITGAIDTDKDGIMDNGETFTTLLTAELLLFGQSGVASPGHDKFDFIFRVQGGSELAAFGGAGAHVGMIFDAGNTAWNGSWASNFSFGGANNSDTFVPEPSTYLLTLVAAAITLVYVLGTGRHAQRAILFTNRDAETGIDAPRHL